jgi:hypothetical protein
MQSENNSNAAPAFPTGFIYNVTIKVHNDIKEEWLNWLKSVHIPEVLETGCFNRATILQLMEIDDSEGPTYAIQYHAESKALYNRYISSFAGILRQRSFDRWGDKFIAFRSVMQVVN